MGNKDFRGEKKKKKKADSKTAGSSVSLKTVVTQQQPELIKKPKNPS